MNYARSLTRGIYRFVAETQSVFATADLGEDTLRKLLAALAFCALTLASASAAPAGTRDGGLLGGLLTGNCPSSGAQVFAPWGDYNSYYLAPNGGVENGSTGWSLSGGAGVVSGNEPFYANGAHSLALPSGSKATSPVACIGLNNLFIRMFGTDAGGTDSGLRVRVLWYGLLNQLLGVTDYGTFAPGAGWGPTSKVGSAGGIDLIVPLVGSTSARVQFTPLGSGSAWRIDDLEVDPWASKCC